MRVGFSKANFDALADLWASCMPDLYKVDAEVLRSHTIESPVFDWGASCMEVSDSGEVLGCVAVKRSGATLYRGPDQDQAHISFIICPDCQLGVDLFAYTKRVLRERGVYKLVFGQDSRHVLPGCPVDAAALRDFLVIEGFQDAGECWDVMNDLAQYDPPAEWLAPLDKSHRVEPLAADDLGKFQKFINREFPGRWTYDTLDKIQVEERPGVVSVLFIDDAIEGFALTQDWTCRTPINGGSFRSALGPNWGALGAIGVSAGVRGNGYGDALLAASLLGMKEKGVRNCIIDWTGLLSWYGKHGFEVRSHYKSMLLRLDEPGAAKRMRD